MVALASAAVEFAPAPTAAAAYSLAEVERLSGCFVLFVPQQERDSANVDRGGGSAWFAADRVTRSLGRGAARRARNPIHVLPVRGDEFFDEVCVVSARGDGVPLQRADLARGPRQLVVIPDETSGDSDERDLAHLGRHVRRVHLEIEHGVRRPFRSVASIALAEIARQVGSWRRPIEDLRTERRQRSP